MESRPPRRRRDPGRMRQRATSSSPTTTAAGLTGWRAPAVFTTPPDTGQIIEPLSANPTDLAAHGYVEQEYFASGTAYSFTSRSTPSDGKWTIAVSGSAPYRTRIIVRRPSDPAKFDGNVVVEWMNVSAGESAPDWDYLDPALMDSGAAYVGVSAQALAVNGGKAILSSGSSPGPAAEGSGPVREPAPPRRPVLPRHVRPDRPGAAGLRPRRSSEGSDRRTWWPSASPSRRSTSPPMPTPSSPSTPPTRASSSTPAEVGPPPSMDRRHPRRSAGNVRIRTDLDRPRLHVRDPDGPDPARLRRGAAAEHLEDPDVGGGGDVPRRRLRGGGGRLPPRLHHPGQLRSPARGGPGRLRRPSCTGSTTAHRHPHRTRSPSPPPILPMLALDAHGNVEGGVRTPAVDVPVSTLERCTAAGQQRTLRPVRVHRPVQSRRLWSPSTDRRPATSPPTPPTSTGPSPPDTSSRRIGHLSWRRPRRCRSPPERTAPTIPPAGISPRLVRQVRKNDRPRPTMRACERSCTGWSRKCSPSARRTTACCGCSPGRRPGSSTSTSPVSCDPTGW